MESLALIASVIFLTVLLSGPVSVLLSRSGFIYVGGLLGLFSMFAGPWFAVRMQFPVAIVGIVTALLGLWSFSQPFQRR